MTSYVTPKKNAEFIFYITLPSVASPGVFQTNPTIAAGDFKVSTDGAAEANPTTLPAVTPAGGKRVKVTLSASEMNGDNISFIASDAAGSEWQDVHLNFQTSARQIDDLATQTSVDTIDDFLDTEIAAIKTKTDFLPSATAGSAGGVFIAGSNAATTVNITGNITGNLSGSVGSIAAGGIAAASFAAGAIDATAIAADAIGSSELAASAANEIADAILTRQMTESYAADGVAPTLAQALFLTQQSLTEFAISGTTITAKKLDGSTTAATYTLDSATTPTSRTRAT